MKNWVLFDVDDVLSNFRQSMYDSLLNLGQDVHWSTWQTYELKNIYKGFAEETSLHEHFLKYNVLENSKVEPQAEKVLKTLSEEGYQIGLITARAWHKDALKVTEDFVNRNNLPVERIVISGLHMDQKSAHINKFEGTIHGFIDDSTHHVSDFISKGVQNVHLLDRPWNKTHTDLPRVDSLEEFAQKILMPDLSHYSRNKKSTLKIS